MNISEDSFSTQTPAHAYPTPYPPTLDDIPFPCVYGDFSFPKPAWHRRATLKAYHSTGRADISELIGRFERLSLTSETSLECNDSQNLNQMPKERTACDAYPFITSTYTAPLPALLPCIRNLRERPFGPVASTRYTPIKQSRNVFPSITQLCFLRPSIERDRLSCAYTAKKDDSLRRKRPERKAPLLDSLANYELHGTQRYYKHLSPSLIRSS